MSQPAMSLFVVERRLPRISEHQLAVLQAALTGAGVPGGSGDVAAAFAGEGALVLALPETGWLRSTCRA